MKKKSPTSSKVLFILHTSPPSHGAARVGDNILNSDLINDRHICKFIRIESSNTMEEIGRVKLIKIYSAITLFFKVSIALIRFKPNKIYFTASVKGVAFYRDLALSLSWKLYNNFRPTDIYYHYHTKGVNNFVSSSKVKLFLTRFFLKQVRLILLNKILLEDFTKIDTYKNAAFISNGIFDELHMMDFNKLISLKYHKPNAINLLYLSHMTKEKGYDFVLDLAKSYKNYPDLHFHFAGSWDSDNDKLYFEQFIYENDLHNVTHHGFVDGIDKDELLKASHLLIYPSLNDAFPLTILESLSYGVPVLSSNQGSIPAMLDDNCGIVMNSLLNPDKYFKDALNMLINKKTAQSCREHFLQNFTIANFENKLTQILYD
ncbi:glycosyltransferase [Gammaproteobacteria bacterium]|nr:glycosyltransferase [Gammaproteobacteria bacterium]